MTDDGPTGTPASDPHVLVIFGATGDLARRKLFPGLLRLYRSGMLPDRLSVIGSGRHSPGTDEEFRRTLGEAVADHLPPEAFDAAAWRELAERITFCTSSAEDGAALAERVRRERERLGAGVRTLVYLSVPPASAETMISMLGSTGIAEGASLVMEKPFGEDLASARSLNAAVHRVVPEERVFRIDHFLGKEAVQNILALRFANGLFEPAWHRNHIAYVQIDVPESIGIEGRAGFMESTGTFRDMLTTHLSQLLGFVALEQPVSFTAAALRAEKLRVYRAMRPLDPSEVVFGQYEGYREEDGVDDASRVETFVALRAWVDSPRWWGVPFLLRTGKALSASRRVVTIGFHEPPAGLFADRVADTCPDELVFELTDEPEITLQLRAKRPGADFALASASLELRFEEAFARSRPLEAYEKLLLDALRGDQTLFTGAAEIERLWEVCAPVLADPPAPVSYARGGWGPQAALDLAGERGWRVSRG
ncbi:glucose-6-phosphate dehydrogenase [Streptomyces bohaiensis]|uniref:Glucose-6-phosphate 1-dehydrogenase n=1 Tax=Streptomyces bohaiensis TaxID=1431344 RepID=A0ABX1C873_9ACTN|nr:glucose-6-phosphate dehydrogenase [Streptomyces bohaiensis]NJQ13795.1 glucose-6-phosphate dehydrogenase [Streptomyces bohaiensis]